MRYVKQFQGKTVQRFVILVAKTNKYPNSNQRSHEIKDSQIFKF